MSLRTYTRIGTLACALGLSTVAQAGEAPHSMTGCLRAGGVAGTFELTDLGLADAPKSVAIADSSVDLAGHVGHKVEITGTTVAGPDTATHTMSISGMKHLAASCP